MNPGTRRLVPLRTHHGAAVLLLLVLGACMGVPDIDSDEAVIVTETGVQPVAAGAVSAREAAVAQMRAQAAQGDLRPYPDAFQSVQTARLAMREEPLSVGDVQAIQAELAAVYRRQTTAVDPREIAALKARAEELLRMLEQAQAAGAARRNDAALKARGEELRRLAREAQAAGAAAQRNPAAAVPPR